MGPFTKQVVKICRGLFDIRGACWSRIFLHKLETHESVFIGQFVNPFVWLS